MFDRSPTGGDIFFYERINKIKKSKIKYDLKNQNLQTSKKYKIIQITQIF